MQIAFPRYLDSNADGYEWLARTASRLDEANRETITFTGTLTWFDAQMCAPFGALLDDARRRLCDFGFPGVSGPVLEIWSKNAFYSHFGGVRMADTYATTLTYKPFARAESELFARYIAAELLSREGELPQFSLGARERFASSVQELYDNASDHAGNASRVYCCGQEYPRRDSIGLCVADLGVGFLKNAQKIIRGMDDELDAIDWAVEEGHTSKRGPIPGGLGLFWLRDFVRCNGGALQIVSGRAFWQVGDETVRRQTLAASFPGSCVTLLVNRADEGTYDDLPASNELF